jgi:hypothetical protein
VNSRTAFETKSISGYALNDFYDYVKKIALGEQGVEADLDTKVDIPNLHVTFNQEQAKDFKEKIEMGVYRANTRFIRSLLDTSFPLDPISQFNGKEILPWLDYIQLWVDKCKEGGALFGGGSGEIGFMIQIQKEVWEELRAQFLKYFNIEEETE